MPVETLVELFGYLGSTMVVVSMLMSSVIKLRVINTVGSVISGTYALIIGSFPLALMNICLVIINVYNLRKLLVTKQQYDLVKCGADDAVVDYFLTHYAQDILLYFPQLCEDARRMDAVYMVLCNADPAGVLLAREGGNGIMEAVVEYTTPKYRDCSVGKFLYAALAAEGVREIVVHKTSEKHKAYLNKMGYERKKESHIKKLK